MGVGGKVGGQAEWLTGDCGFREGAVDDGDGRVIDGGREDLGLGLGGARHRHRHQTEMSGQAHFHFQSVSHLALVLTRFSHTQTAPLSSAGQLGPAYYSFGTSIVPAPATAHLPTWHPQPHTQRHPRLHPSRPCRWPCRFCCGFPLPMRLGKLRLCSAGTGRRDWMVAWLRTASV